MTRAIRRSVVPRATWGSCCALAIVIAGVIGVSAWNSPPVSGSVVLHGIGGMTGSGGAPASSTSSPSAPAAHRANATSFAIHGGVAGLYPGIHKSLPLTVVNAMRFAFRVTSITTTVTSGKPGCPAAELTVAKYPGSMIVPAGDTRTADVMVSMSKAATNACQHAVFIFHYLGLAVAT